MDEKNTSRRDFLKGLFKTSAALLLGYALLDRGSRDNFALIDTPANKLLTELPYNLPNASKVKKIFNPGAKQCLMYIRQIHDRPEITDQDSLFEIRKVQDDIYRILNFFIDHYQLKEVYDEGLFPEIEAPLRSLQKIIGLGKKLNDLGIDSMKSTLVEEIDYLKEKLEEDDLSISLLFDKEPEVYRRETRERIKYIQDVELPKLLEMERNEQEAKKQEKLKESAVMRLFDEGRLDYKSAETITSNLRGNLEADKLIKGEKYSEERIMGDRENQTLEIIAQEKKLMPVLVYGGAHNFRDNIDQWNGKHPDKIFSLAVITPLNYNR